MTDAGAIQGADALAEARAGKRIDHRRELAAVGGERADFAGFSRVP